MTTQRRPTGAGAPILSLFPGIDLLGRAFEEAGYCVARGPDLLWGGDIRRFEPPAGHYWGVIAGPPCQDFSSLRRSELTGYGLEMLAEFRRCVVTAEPEWWLMENVARVPDLVIHGWHWQRLDVNQGWFCDVTRLRHFQFGSRSGVTLHVDKPRDRTQTVTGEEFGQDLLDCAGLENGTAAPQPVTNPVNPVTKATFSQLLGVTLALPRNVAFSSTTRRGASMSPCKVQPA